MARKASVPASALLEKELEELHKQRPSKKHKVAFSQLQEALESPENFQAYVDGLDTKQAPWLPHKQAKGWKKVRQQIKHFLTAFHPLYFQPLEDSYDYLKPFLQSFSMILLRDLLKNTGFWLIIVPIR